MRILFLAALVAVSGCAAQPESSADPAAAATAMAAAATSQSTSPGAAAALAEPEKFKPPTGYKTQVRDGATVYCTKIVVLGSRFPKEDCRTQAELRDLEAQKEASRAEMDQQRRVCTSAAGCANP